jgi:predicted porin
VLAVTNNAAFANQKVLEVYWAGAKWGITPDLDMTAAYYGYSQNSYATGANAGCSTKANGACSGSETGLSLVLDYKLSKRFDTYLGTFYSGVENGLANGYLFSTNIATTAGVRFRF